MESKVSFSDGKVNESVTAQAGIDINRKGMDIAQSFGSSSSYARKYALSGLFLIDDNKEIESITEKVTTKAKPELKSETQAFFKALKAVQDGNTTIAKIKEYYTITTEAERLLEDAK